MEKNGLLLRMDSSATLNFLVYVYNLYQNQRDTGHPPAFPWIPGEYDFHKDFELHSRAMWDETIERIAADPVNDIKLFKEKKELFFGNLFVEEADFYGVYHSFYSWWNSFTGKFSLERSVDDKLTKLYQHLTETIDGIEISISLIYDDFPLSQKRITSDFAVISVRDFIVDFDKTTAALQKEFSI